MRIFEFNVPNIGDYKEVAVVEVMVRPGDKVAADQPVIVLESDKATIDVPVPHGGTVCDVRVQVGHAVSEGSHVLTLELEEGCEQIAVPTEPPEPECTNPPPGRDLPTSELAAAPAQETTMVETEVLLQRSSPSIRKLARELGVALEHVCGTGPKGRVTRADVHAYVKAALPQALEEKASPSASQLLDLLPWPSIEFSRFGKVESRPLSRIQKISGANLHRNWVCIPHVTTHEDADITEIEAFRASLNSEFQKEGGRLTLLPFIIKASAAALRTFPAFNASLHGDEVVYKQYCHIGFAADTPRGLVVPVIRNADSKGLLELAAECAELASAARAGTLRPEQMQGGCFSISSLGGIGATGFTPIINAPEVAILGISRSATKPIWNGEVFEPRLMLPMSLSWDHRVIDGAQAARFNVFIARMLADFRRLAL